MLPLGYQTDKNNFWICHILDATGTGKNCYNSPHSPLLTSFKLFWKGLVKCDLNITEYIYISKDFDNPKGAETNEVSSQEAYGHENCEFDTLIFLLVKFLTLK